jgi:molybdate transport system substrate-binding protein
MKRLVFGGLFAALALVGQPLQAGELKVMVAGVVEPAVADLAAQYEKASGSTLKIEYGFAVDMNKRVQAGEPVDVVIFPDGLIDQPATAATLSGKVPFARIGQGVAVKKGAAKPDVSSPEAFKQALLKAKSVAFVPTGQTGIATLKVFETLGTAEEMKAKTKTVKAEDVVSAVVEGKAELALFLNNYLVGNPQVDYAGPYPGNLQSFIVFSGGLSTKATDMEAARAFVKFLTAPSAAPALKAHGMEPG